MSDDTTPEQLRQELKDIDAQIAELRHESGGVLSSVGQEGDGVQNSEDIAADLTGVEENDAVIEILQQRREAVQRRLGESG
ncbi:MAG TPA: hypothetical protein VH373_02755 [Jatrophihabitantaceae bacterium]|jgi:hypothetical protein